MDTTTSVQCSLTHTIHVHHILASSCNQERAHCNESMAGIFHEFTIIPFSFMSLHLRPCSSSLRSLSEINHNSDKQAYPEPGGIAWTRSQWKILTCLSSKLQWIWMIICTAGIAAVIGSGVHNTHQRHGVQCNFLLLPFKVKYLGAVNKVIPERLTRP